MTIASILDAVKAHEEQDRLVAAGYQTSINELQAKLTGAPVAPTPAPVSGRTFFGACPTNSGTIEQVVSKYGTGVAVRRFMGDLTAAAVRPAGVGVMHWSWKPTLAGITPALVTSALKACQDNDGVEVWHEGDKKVRDGVFSRADLIAIKNKFWTTVDGLRKSGAIKKVKVVNTLTGWEAEPKNTTTRGNIDGWADVKAEYLGLDFDGINSSSNNYVDYYSEINTAVNFLASHPAYEGWCVPEFGAPRYSGDSTGSYRATWFKNIGAATKAKGCKWVCQFDYTMALDYRLVAGSPELAAWKSLVAGG